MLRRALYEAANVALSQVKRPFALQEWGRKMAEAKGAKRARTAFARQLAALLHSLRLNETEFRWALARPHSSRSAMPRTISSAK